MKQICQLSNLITNSQLLKQFIEPILTNALIWMIVVRILNDLPPPRIFHFADYFTMDKKITHRRKHLFFDSKHS